ncbi:MULTISPECIES: KilA-N domain-containing protein [unclassified Sphingomonas]|uniref:KilA-N domain-containing protein n=1 Tax=unclassified Sphingomonas TaxID=196159 RepID=UPI00226A8251|nr:MULTISPECIES: KilA-N domain-containing protein [unclassified Sphingomonas]
MSTSPTQHSASQFQLTLVPHTYQGSLIQQRATDGYINATAMCKAAGSEWSAYRRIGQTEAFITSLERSLQIHRDLLIQSIVTGANDVRGTWVHPQVAINLASYLSGDFAVQVSQWVLDWMSGKGAPRRPAELPFHIRRYLANQYSVPTGHFSVLTELTLLLIAPMEALGYSLPERLWPDISSGRMFAKFLRDEHGIDTDAMPTYIHTFEDKRQPVRAKAYPEKMIHHFRAHFRNVWLPQRAADYFADRDGAALAYLPRLLTRRAA